MSAVKLCHNVNGSHQVYKNSGLCVHWLAQWVEKGKVHMANNK